ncbi:MAG: hypothetical protein IKY58_01115, partial [Paludibacteraceae bacterium]|nr:hypothetical protein [Paludibacteraceae bacterium]
AKEAGGQAIYIAPLQPNYPCCDQTLGDSKGAGRIGLTRCKSRYNFLITKFFRLFFSIRLKKSLNLHRFFRENNERGK